MVFHVNNRIFILFEEWKIVTWRDTMMTFIFTMLMSLLYACCREYQSYLGASTRGMFNSRKRMLRHTGATTVYVIQLVLAYLVMLLVMTFHVGLLSMVVLGIGLGYFVTNPLTKIFRTHQNTLLAEETEIAQL